MVDKFGRDINYLRVSVTDLCNLRCRYCMPAEGVYKKDRSEILSIEEIVEITAAAASLGITKVRITGGEPLIRSGILDICRGIKAIPEIKELAMTTNGLLLEEMALDLRAAGVDRVNISIDTFDPQKFALMTRGGDLFKVLRGIEAAKKAGLTPIKLNSVLIGGFNDDEIDTFVGMTQDEPTEVRFIELMPIGESIPYWEDGFLQGDAVLSAVPALMPAPGEACGVAKKYRLPDGAGSVGLISPVSSHFCHECNRLRLTADGMLKPCLLSELEVPVRGLHGGELADAVRSAIERKPQSRGDELSGSSPGATARRMNQIGG